MRRRARFVAAFASVLSVVGSVAGSLPVSAATAASGSSSSSSTPLSPHYPAPQAKMAGPASSLHIRGGKLDPRFMGAGAATPSSSPATTSLGASSPYSVPPVKAYSGPRGYVEGKSLAVHGQWDASHRVYLNPDGTYSMKIYGGPVNYRDASGTWQAIDGTIVRNADGTMRPTGLPVGLQFAASSNASDLVRMDDGAGDTVRFGAPDGATAGAAGTASGIEVRYPAVFSGVDLEYFPSADGVKELVVLDSAAAAAAQPSFSFPMQLGALHATMRKDGGVDIVDASGTPRFTIPAPVMTDSNVDQKLGDGKHGPVSYSLSTRGATTVLTITPDAAWLADPARVYPVYVDPTLDTRPFGPSQRWDAYVASSYPDSFQGDYWDTALSPNRWVVNLGLDPSGASGVNRSYAYYALDPLINNYTRIISANWNGYTAWTYYAPGSTSSSYVLEPPSSAWNGGTITWHTQPSCCESGFITISGPTYSWNWNIDITNWVVHWANSQWGHNGVEMASTNEASATTWRRIASVKNTDGSQSYMLVNYEQYNTQYSFSNSDWDSGTTSNAYRGPLPSTNATLPVYVTNNGTNAWNAGDIYRLSYHVYDRNGNQLVWDGVRTYMPTTVSPGQGIWLNATIGGLNPGSYTLQWDMVEEGVTWFSQYGQGTAGFRIFVSSPPTDQSPASGALVAAAPTLTVNPVGGAAVYRFQFGTDSSFNTTLESTGWQSSNSYTVPSSVLTDGTTYYWRAIAADGADVTGQWSSTFSLDYDSRRVNVQKSLVNPPPGGVYAKGDPVTFQIALSNPGSFATTVSVADTLPTGMVATGAQVLVNAAACAGSITCTLSGQTINIGGLSVPGATSSGPGTLIVQVSAVATGLDRACATLQNAASATASYGTVTSSPVSFVVCNSGLGFENWWSYAGRSVGPGVSAQVNAANGNLVLQQNDFSPVQLHGHLALGLRRTYNSEEVTAATLPGSMGRGWTFNISEAGDLGDAGAGADGLDVPPVPSPLDAVMTAPPVTLVDQDGTRHTFTPNGISTPIDVTSVASAPADLAAVVNDVSSVLSLDTGSGYTHLCVDQTYTAPAGVHLGLWRFVEVGAGCSTISGNSHAVLGFATMRPDRMLSVFSWDGHLLDIRDGAGNEIRYTYANAPVAGGVLGNLLTISEPVTGREFVFSYPGPTEMDVVDPAGRIGKYMYDGGGLSSHLTEVLTLAKDGSTILSDWKYAYGGCGGSADQLCQITDPNGHPASFHYTASFADGPAVLGPAHLDTITDRLGTPTSVASTTNPDETTVIEGNEQTTFQFPSGDTIGRADEIDAGAKGGTPTPHQTLYSWDASGATCRSDGKVDNDLCSMTRTSGTTATPNQVTSYTYGPNGELLDQRQALASGNLDTTYGYHTQYLLADGAVNCVDETVSGSGAVATGATTQCVAPFSGLSDTHVVYAVVDKTQSLTPRGNAAGSGYAPYLTTYKVDDAASVAPGPPPSTVTADICANPSGPTSNTGSLCETDAPDFDGSHATVTRYTYNPSDGERKTMTTPKAIAENLSGSYAYVYYPDSGADVTQTKDLSGSTAQGGWLKAVVDPTGHFVAYAYDAAGNVVRTWDRNATSDSSGNPLSIASFPGTVATPPASTYTETLHQATSVTTGSPWLFLRSQRDPLGNTTTYTVDSNGNQLTVRPPRGNQAGATSFDVTQTFDDNDELVTRQLPVEASSGAHTTNTYDMYGNLVATTDPLGNVRTFQYDSVNREVSAKWTRGPSSGPSPSACTTSTSSDAPIPLGKVVCSTTTTYDNVDNKMQTQDGNHQNTNYTYDAVHRLVSQVGPRIVGSGGTRTDYVYDADGHVTAVCPPNLWASGATACPDGRYAETRSYDVAGRLTGTTTYRESLDNSSSLTTLTTGSTYDADGNALTTTDANGHVVSSVYDILDRRDSQTTYRDSAQTIAVTTTWTYDPAGNTTSVTAPGSRITAYLFDADNRAVQTVQGADSTSAALAGLPDSAGGRDIRTGVVYDADGNVVARLDPRAYATSTTSPDASYMVRTDFDADGRATTQYVPRYSSSVTDPTTNTTQTTQCPTTAPAPVTGVPAYPAGVGLCVTTAQYDAAGDITKVILPTSNGADNRFVAYTYTDDKLLSGVDSPDPAVANARTQGTTIFDADGEPVTVTDPLGHSQSTTYYPDELVHFSTDQLNHTTTYSYDANGNQTLLNDPMGIQTQTDYYADNLRKHVVAAAQDTTGTYKSTTAYAYDNAGNVTTVYSPSAWLVHTGLAADANNQLGTPSTTAYTYDNLVSYSVDPVIAKSGQALQQRRTDYGYDLGGRKTSQHTYLVDSNLNAIAGGDAGTQSFSYYQDDRQSQQTGRNAGETISTSYDPAGNSTSIQDSTGGGSTITATYYLDSRPRTVDDGAKTSEYAYDGSGMVLTRAEANDGLLSTPSLSTTYSYDDAGFAASMQSTVVGNVPTSYAYDHAGRVVGESDPNGTSQAWTYNNDDTLATHTASTATSTVASWSYLYNADRQQTQQNFSGTAALTNSTGLDTQQFAYGYDPAGRLNAFTTGVSPAQTTKSLSFDHNGNRLSYGSDTYSYNADDSIASFTPSGGSAENFTYYAFGGLKSDTCLNSTYDGFDRLTSSTAAGTCGTGANGTYTYDGLDRQRSHQEGAAAATPLHYDGMSKAVVIESPTLGDISYELAADGSRRGVAQATTIQYLADDGLGNITTVTGVGGTVACTARFDPFGNPRNAQGTTAGSRNACNTGSTIDTFFYRGARQDQTTGDYQMGSRTYDPSKSAFLTPDSYRGSDAGKNVSIGTDPLTANRYSYVNGDPINLVDPSGHDACRENPQDCVDGNGKPDQGLMNAQAAGTRGATGVQVQQAEAHGREHAMAAQMYRDAYRRAHPGDFAPGAGFLAPLPDAPATSSWEDFVKWWTDQVKGGAVSPDEAPIPGSALAGASIFAADALAIGYGLLQYMTPSEATAEQNDGGPRRTIVLGYEENVGDLTDELRKAGVRNVVNYMDGLRWNGKLWVDLNFADFTTAMKEAMDDPNTTFVVDVRGVGQTEISRERIGKDTTEEADVRRLVNLAADNADVDSLTDLRARDATVTAYELTLLRRNPEMQTSRLHFVNWGPGEGSPTYLPYNPLNYPWTNHNNCNNSPGAC